MFKKILLTFLLLGAIITYSAPTYAENEEPVYTQLREVDKGTFNEYRYRITDAFFDLRNNYEVNGGVDVNYAREIFTIATKSYKYLPDSLSNKNYYNQLKAAIASGIKYPNNVSNYTSIVIAIENYLDKTNIKTIKGNITATPKTGNAPLTTTLRANVVDPTGTKIPSYNYTWWMHKDGQRIILGDNISYTHVFKEEGSFAIFLDVSSAHKNEGGYTDVLSFSSRADIVIKEKIASVIIKVNSTSLRNNSEIKFTPDEARYGLLFDATSSTPTDGAKFIKTTWDFGNGVERSYTGDPRVERVVYAKEGEFTVTLKLKTNELKQIERKFVIAVHDPIATINASQEEGYLGDKFTFSAQNSGNNKDLSYSWEIIDLNQDKVIFRKAGTLFTYSFKEKGKYNLKMKVTEPSGEVDVDTKIIYINSRAPSADFTSKIPFPNKPNKVFLDGTKSFDPDFSDDGKLKYSWIINGDRVKLEEPNFNGSTGYFTFDSIGEHSVVLEVEDPDNISSQKKTKVKVTSILSVEFFAFPRVAQRNNTVRFVTSSPEAKFYEWDFGDSTNKGGSDSNISHKYEKSGIFNVKLKVRDADDNVNSFSKNVYIGDSNSPYSFIGLRDKTQNDIAFDTKACDGKGAYLVNRVDSVTFSGKESINITGENTGLTYSWKLGKESYKNSSEFTKKFDELGCFPVKLTVKSSDNGKTHNTTTYIKVNNIEPILSSIDVRITDDTTDPVIVKVTALGAKDIDGVIQSYLWYYYTDIDSEPQDFRATKSPSTSFVLPKVTGNYYFVVVMKDNNEARSNSEEITGSKYFMTLTGDNLNTPLVKLSVADSSISIGDEAIFTVNVENILGQDLSNKVKYSWDFDGDGFYDKETEKNVVSHNFISSGEKHIKVKAKYKGFSNTKSITVNIANVLKPAFGYISIGSKFIFFDKSIGTSESYEWNLGDGEIVKNKEGFVHEYTDKKVSHIVKLKISEGTKVKEIEQKVVRNVKNRILANKDGLVVLSNPSIKDDEIILDKEGDNAFIYLGASKPDAFNYVIDSDLDYDSDLNGGNDDDEDNKKYDSYTTGNAIKVELNDNKFQKIRVFAKTSSGELLGSRDITIIKNYVKEEEIDLNSIIFKGISDSTKFKIEKLKEEVSGLPKEHKLKALMYVQKLQEEWSDNREKTNVILEFEGFIYDIAVANGDNIVNLLESLLVENQEDKSEKAVTFNALKNLIPTSIVCEDMETGESSICYEEMVLKLEAIRDNENVDENKVLGSEILVFIGQDKVMTNKEKLDFKAILATFVYGGVANIPDDEKANVLNEDIKDSSSALGDLVVNIIIWLLVIVGIFVGAIGIFYIIYLVSNKNDNIGFQDFIIEKTSGVKQIKNEVKTDIEDDILADLNEDIDEKIETANLEEEKEEKEEKIEEQIKNEIKKEIKNEIKKEEKVEVKKTSKEEVPDWLKGSFSEETSEVKKEEVKKEKIKEPISEEILSDEKIEEITKLEDPKVKEKSDDNIPDWLKGSFDEEPKKEEKDKTSEKKSDDNIPDWLKGSFDEEPKKEEKTEEKKIENKKVVEKKEVKEESKKPEVKTKEVIKKEISKVEIKEEKQESKPKTTTKKKSFNKPKLKVIEVEKKEPIKKEPIKKVENTPIQKKETKQEIKEEKSPELWDDGMKVPDWLKTDEDK